MINWIEKKLFRIVNNFISCKKRIEFDNPNMIHLFHGEDITDPHIQKIINAKKKIK